MKEIIKINKQINLYLYEENNFYIVTVEGNVVGKYDNYERANYEFEYISLLELDGKTLDKLIYNLSSYENLIKGLIYAEFPIAKKLSDTVIEELYQTLVNSCDFKGVLPKGIM